MIVYLENSFSLGKHNYVSSRIALGCQQQRIQLHFSGNALFLPPITFAYLLHSEKKDRHMQVIGLHQNRLVHASKMTRFRVCYQHILDSLPTCIGKLSQNLVNLLALAGQLWMCKLTCLCGLVLMQVTSFFSECTTYLHDWFIVAYLLTLNCFVPLCLYWTILHVTVCNANVRKKKV